MQAQIVLQAAITYGVLAPPPRCCVKDFICGISLYLLNTLHHKKCSVIPWEPGGQPAREVNRHLSQPSLENLPPASDKDKYGKPQTDNTRVRDC